MCVGSFALHNKADSVGLDLNLGADHVLIILRINQHAVRVQLDTRLPEDFAVDVLLPCAEQNLVLVGADLRLKLRKLLFRVRLPAPAAAAASTAATGFFGGFLVDIDNVGDVCADGNGSVQRVQQVNG